MCAGVGVWQLSVQKEHRFVCSAATVCRLPSSQQDQHRSRGAAALQSFLFQCESLVVADTWWALIRACLFLQVEKRDDDSSLMQLKEEVRSGVSVVVQAGQCG